MTNLAKFITTYGSDQLATYIMDIFKHTFLAEIAETEDYVAIMLNIKAAKKLSPAAYGIIASKVAPILSRYGVASLDEWPDYSEFVKLIVKKFGGVFASIKLDGKDGLV